MPKMIGKMKEFLGFEAEEEYEDDFLETEDDFEEDYEPVVKTPLQSSVNNSNKVVSIHTASSAKVVITKPTSYDDSLEICNSLRNRNIVIINTSALETKVARRLLDFVSGASYALDGNLDDIENRVYILSPSNVNVTNELKTELSSKGIFNWK